MALTLDRPAVESSHLRRLTWLLVAMAVAIGADQGFQWATHDVAPGLFLLPAVIVIAAVGGLVDGLAAAAIALVFAAVDLGGTGPLWVPPYDRAVRLLVLCVSAPTAGLVVGLMRRRLMERSATKLSDRVQAERTRADARATSDGRAFAAERASLLHERDALADIDREHQRRLTDLIEAVPGVVWEVVIDGPRLRVAFISHYIQDLLGYDADRWTGSGDLWSSAVHPDDRDRVARWLREACDSGTTAASNAAPAEFRWLAKDGSEVWVETRLAAVPGAGTAGRCVALRGVTSDITARKTLEADAGRRAAELATVARRLRESNEELDQFAYITSHDLKAPLRGISNLSDWIEEDLGPDRVTAEAHGQFDLLRGRVMRMERLIDGLLQYSQVGRTAGTVEWVDVNLLLAEVVDWVGPPPAIRVTIGPDMPSFNCDRLRFGQVLANLVGNAVKHHGDTAGWVRVTCEPAAGAVDGFRFTVADDGPGIAPRYHEKIFGVFQTLQPRDRVEGTGIGLALVRKVVSAKGGTITVDSAVGRGAAFSFTWPRVDPGAHRPAAASRRPVPPAQERLT